jgi:hypothetical protein
MPILDRQTTEASKILRVCGHHHEIIDARDRGNLRISCGGWPPSLFKARALSPMPFRCLLVVRQNRQRPTNRFLKIGFDRPPLLPGRKSRSPVSEFVPDD